MKHVILFTILITGLLIGRFTVTPSQNSESCENVELERLLKENASLKSELEKRPEFASRAEQSLIEKSKIAEVKESVPTPTPNDDPVAKPLSLLKKRWLQVEKNIPQIGNRSEVAAFLEKVRIESTVRSAFALQLELRWGGLPDHRECSAISSTGASFSLRSKRTFDFNDGFTPRPG